MSFTTQESIATSLRFSFLIYFVIVHAIVAVAVAKTDLVQKVQFYFGVAKGGDGNAGYVSVMRGMHHLVDQDVEEGAVLFFGDSHVQGLAVTSVHDKAVNFGIGWQNSKELSAAFGSYASMKRASAVVIMIGTNDIVQGIEDGYGARLASILSAIPENQKTVVVAPPPLGISTYYQHQISPNAVEVLGLEAKGACAARVGCKFVNPFVGADRTHVLEEDGIHLSAKGRQILISALRLELN